MTAVYVTHDQAEAMALATRIAVMNKGRIVQYAPPIEIYRRPATTFVANFVGNPPMNLVPVEAVIGKGRLNPRADGTTIARLPASNAIARAVTAAKTLTLGIRPEHLLVAKHGDSNTISGALFANENMGPEKLVTLERPDAGRVPARIFSDDEIILGDTVSFGFAAEHIHLFDSEGKRIPGVGE